MSRHEPASAVSKWSVEAGRTGTAKWLGSKPVTKVAGCGGGAWFLRLWAGGGGGGLGDNTHPTFSVNC